VRFHHHDIVRLTTNKRLEQWIVKPATRAGVTGYQEGEDAWCVASSEGAWKWGIKDGADLARLAADAPTLAERLSGLPEPSAMDIATRGIEAFVRWAKAGLPVVDEETLRRRKATCGTCELWQPEARAGLGRCNHKSCCCTKLKWWLKTEKCPTGKWAV